MRYFPDFQGRRRETLVDGLLLQLLVETPDPTLPCEVGFHGSNPFARPRRKPQKALISLANQRFREIGAGAPKCRKMNSLGEFAADSEHSH
jgi:hypothetical protein